MKSTTFERTMKKTLCLFVLLNEKQEKTALKFMILAQFDKKFKFVTCFMAFSAHSSAQNCQFGNSAAHKNLLLEGLVRPQRLTSILYLGYNLPLNYWKHDHGWNQLLCLF